MERKEQVILGRWYDDDARFVGRQLFQFLTNFVSRFVEFLMQRHDWRFNHIPHSSCGSPNLNLAVIIGW